ncbi:hypothetical protein DRO38_07200, partial [Candidatus Bathyarchaeota archaeon]
KFIFIKGVQGISSRVEKNLMIHSLRESSVMHILEDGICEEFGDPPKLVIYLNRFVMEGLGGIRLEGFKNLRKEIINGNG